MSIFRKLTKDDAPLETVANLLKMHEKARRDLSDTLSERQFEMRDTRIQRDEAK
jgi:hypothetical protein